MPMYPPRPNVEPATKELYDPKNVVRLLIGKDMFYVKRGTYSEEEINFETPVLDGNGMPTGRKAATNIEMYSFIDAHEGLRWIGYTKNITSMGLDETT